MTTCLVVAWTERVLLGLAVAFPVLCNRKVLSVLFTVLRQQHV